MWRVHRLGGGGGRGQLAEAGHTEANTAQPPHLVTSSALPSPGMCSPWVCRLVGLVPSGAELTRVKWYLYSHPSFITAQELGAGGGLRQPEQPLAGGPQPLGVTYLPPGFMRMRGPGVVQLVVLLSR